MIRTGFLGADSLFSKFDAETGLVALNAQPTTAHSVLAEFSHPEAMSPATKSANRKTGSQQMSELALTCTGICQADTWPRLLITYNSMFFGKV